MDKNELLELIATDPEVRAAIVEVVTAQTTALILRGSEQDGALRATLQAAPLAPVQRGPGWLPRAPHQKPSP